MIRCAHGSAFSRSNHSIHCPRLFHSFFFSPNISLLADSKHGRSIRGSRALLLLPAHPPRLGAARRHRFQVGNVVREVSKHRLPSLRRHDEIGVDERLDLRHDRRRLRDRRQRRRRGTGNLHARCRRGTSTRDVAPPFLENRVRSRAMMMMMGMTMMVGVVGAVSRRRGA